MKMTWECRNMFCKMKNASFFKNYSYSAVFTIISSTFELRARCFYALALPFNLVTNIAYFNVFTHWRRVIHPKRLCYYNFDTSLYCYLKYQFILLPRVTHYLRLFSLFIKIYSRLGLILCRRKVVHALSRVPTRAVPPGEQMTFQPLVWNVLCK